VALVTILAHMGLPVPAESARVERVAELHYHAKTQGTLDAGAFEATLRDFGGLVTGISSDRPIMVLVDELEVLQSPAAPPRPSSPASSKHWGTQRDGRVRLPSRATSSTPPTPTSPSTASRPRASSRANSA